MGFNNSAGRGRSIQAVNLANLLAERGDLSPKQLAYRFLASDREEHVVTYEQLAHEVEILADCIRRCVSPGQRVLLVYPAGLDFVRAFYACALANVVAVPLPVPRVNEPIDRLTHVLEDCDPSAIFTVARLQKEITQHLPERYRESIAATDAAFELSPLRGAAQADSDIILLQYTSGSTTRPKGVVVRHANLIANLQQIERRFEHGPESAGVIWLPHYHDMGLVGGILQPMFTGFPVTLLPPLAFVQKPLRWLRAIHKYRATTSGGPNFAYELCVSKAAQLEDHVDLSCWSVAFNGAEQVRSKTLNAFSEAFAKFGFKRCSFVPCYGLAEATLIVAAVPPGRMPMIRDWPIPSHANAGKASHDGNALVSCGPPVAGTNVQILREVSRESCDEGEIGEIVVGGPAVATGYWQKSDSAFQSQPMPTFSTGDLGFKIGEEIFVTGRIRDLIVIRGRNHFPEDIEAAMQAAQPLLACEAAVAFVAGDCDKEQLVLLQEISSRSLRSIDLHALREDVLRTVALSHGIHVSDFLVLRSGSLVRTSSGKISRSACRQYYLDDKFRSLLHNEPALED
ncbi:fatty acyl-AMP ligase [Ramlibacter sp.]|uniref:fatty acyl-AMP ligase n=1 Tax=Ramlibacter sp. TaxID=1917967 RepID=UPI003D09AFCD